jgi:hypothetical protein
MRAPSRPDWMRERSLSFRGDAKHRTRNLEIPGLVPTGGAKRRPVAIIPE